MLQRSIDSYLRHTPAPHTVFSDRGLPDTLGYARLIGLKNELLLKSIEEACWEYRYNTLAFIAPPWKEIYETDGERKQDFAEAERTFDQIVEVYRRCGYELAEIHSRRRPFRQGPVHSWASGRLTRPTC
jgi:predicted ATPase